MAIGWPLVTLSDSIKISAKRAREGRSPFLSSFHTLYRAALLRNVPPAVGALYEWALELKSTELSDVLLPLDLRALQRLSLGRGAVLEDVQNKARFEQICRSYHLPCVPTLATFDHGSFTGEEALRNWVEPLFVKALTGNRGVGAELWTPGGRGFTSSTSDDLTADQLIESLKPQNCIVQPALEDHPTLRGFGTVALSNVRVVTAKGRTIPSTPLAASVSLAVEPGSITGHEGIHCGINLENGQITMTLAPIEEDSRLSNRNLIGFLLPDWSECVRLVCKAHDEAFPAFTALGWDVALTPTGPVLLEANLNWGMFGHQRLSGPLGKTALAEIIDELLGLAGDGRRSASHPSKPGSRSPSPAPQATRAPSGARGRRLRRPAMKAS